MPTFFPSPDTFSVEEIPAYLPCGSGEHCYLWIEKRLITTPDAASELARRLAVSPREIGYAGMKDKHATTRQWMSVAGLSPERALTVSDDRLRILRAELHGNKLRVGHLRGNRFQTVVALDPDEDSELLVAGLRQLAAEGLPNRYGDQRFGGHGDNVARGLALLRGDERERNHRRRRLLLSAVQSAVFNEVLDRRAASGWLRRVLSGDVLQKNDSGGIFVTDAPEIDQARLDAGEVTVTGPMPGSWAREPPPDTEARGLEDDALAAVGVTRESLASHGRDLPGTRRPLIARVILSEPQQPICDEGARAVRLSFELPAGSYATVLLSALGVQIEGRTSAASPSE